MVVQSRFGRVGFYLLSVAIWTVCGFFSETPVEWLSDATWMRVGLMVQWLMLTIVSAVAVRFLLRQKPVRSVRTHLLVAYLGFALARAAVWTMYLIAYAEPTPVTSANPALFVALGALSSASPLITAAGVAQTIGVLVIVWSVNWLGDRRQTHGGSGT